MKIRVLILIIGLVSLVFLIQNSLALAQALDEENFQLLISYLKSDNAVLKKEAIIVFGEIKEKKAPPYLIPLLKDNNSEIKVLTCEALAEIGDERAVTPLIKVLKDSDQKVREAARNALKTILRYKKP